MPTALERVQVTTIRPVLVAAAVAAFATVGSGAAFAAPAEAKPEATLTCDGEQVGYPITGFGRGQAFHVVGSTTSFVVTKAQIVSAGETTTVFDNPGRAGRGGVLTCRTTSPIGTDYVFTGFFTPLG